MLENAWYGIDEIEFVWHGEWADPGLKFYGDYTEVGSFYVEDALWDDFNSENGDELKNATDLEAENLFDEWMKTEWAREDAVETLSYCVDYRKVELYWIIHHFSENERKNAYGEHEYMIDEIEENENDFIYLYDMNGKKYKYGKACGDVEEEFCW